MAPTTALLALAELEVDGISRDDALLLIASAERPSEHPIAHAIVQAAKDAGVAIRQASDFQAVNGLGIAAIADPIKDNTPEAIDSLQRAGHTHRHDHRRLSAYCRRGCSAAWLRRCYLRRS